MAGPLEIHANTASPVVPVQAGPKDADIKFALFFSVSSPCMLMLTQR